MGLAELLAVLRPAAPGFATVAQAVGWGVRVGVVAAGCAVRLGVVAGRRGWV
jgi:hypothetical protein